MYNRAFAFTEASCDVRRVELAPFVCKMGQLLLQTIDSFVDLRG